MALRTRDARLIFNGETRSTHQALAQLVRRRIEADAEECVSCLVPRHPRRPAPRVEAGPLPGESGTYFVVEADSWLLPHGALIINALREMKSSAT